MNPSTHGTYFNKTTTQYRNFGNIWFSIYFINLIVTSLLALEITDMLPGILNQLGPESLTHLKKLANNVTTQFKANDDDDVPGLIYLKYFSH